METTLYNGVKNVKLQHYFELMRWNHWVHTTQLGHDDEGVEVLMLGFKDITGDNLMAVVYDHHVDLYLIEYVKNTDSPINTESWCPYDDNIDVDEFINYLMRLPITVTSLKKANNSI